MSRIKTIPTVIHVIIIFQIYESMCFQCASVADPKRFKFRNMEEYLINNKSFDPIITDFISNEIEIVYMPMIIKENMFATNYSNDLIGLTLKDNRISSIRKQAFTNLSCLELLDLTNNTLISIDAKAFDGLLFLKHLYLSHNKLMILPQGIFRNLINVKLMDLSSNMLTDLGAGLFNNLESLYRLNLSSNALDSFSMNDWQKLQNLEYLDLSFNALDKLYYVPSFNLSKIFVLYLNSNQFIRLDVLTLKGFMPKLYTIVLDKNVWNCESLGYILKNLGTTRITHALKNETTKNINGIDCTDTDTPSTEPSHLTESYRKSTTSTIKPAIPVKCNYSQEHITHLENSVLNLTSLVIGLLFLVIAFVTFDVLVRIGVISRVAQACTRRSIYDNEIENFGLLSYVNPRL